MRDTIWGNELTKRSAHSISRCDPETRACIASLPVSNIPIREWCAHQAVGSRLWRFRLVIENSKEPAKVRFGVTSLNLLHSNPISVHFWFYFWNSFFVIHARRPDVCAHCDASPQKKTRCRRDISLRVSFLISYLTWLHFLLFCRVHVS